MTAINFTEGQVDWAEWSVY